MAATIQRTSRTYLHQSRMMQQPNAQQLSSRAPGSNEQQELAHVAAFGQTPTRSVTHQHQESVHEHQPAPQELQDSSGPAERLNPSAVLLTENPLRVHEMSAEGIQAFNSFQRPVSNSITANRLPQLSLAPEKVLLDPQTRPPSVNTRQQSGDLALVSGNSVGLVQSSPIMQGASSGMSAYQPAAVRSRGELGHILLESNDADPTRNTTHLAPVAVQSRQPDFSNNEQQQANVYYQVSQTDIPPTVTYEEQPLPKFQAGFNQLQEDQGANISQYHSVPMQGQYAEAVVQNTSLPGMQRHQVNQLPMQQSPHQASGYQTALIDPHRSFHISQQDQQILPHVHYVPRPEEPSFLSGSTHVIRPSSDTGNLPSLAEGGASLPPSQIAQQITQSETFVENLGSHRQVPGYAPGQLVPLGNTRQAHPTVGHVSLLTGAPPGAAEPGIVQYSQSEGNRFDTTILNPNASVPIGQTFTGQSFIPGLLEPSIRSLDCTNNLDGIQPQITADRTSVSARVPGQDALALGAPIMTGQPAQIGIAHVPNPALNYGGQPVDSSHAYLGLQQNIGNALQMTGPVQQHGVIEQSVPIMNGFVGQPATYPHTTLVQVPSNHPSTVQTFENQMAIGYTYRNMGRHDLAIEAFRSAACVRPDSSEARSCFALACHEQGLYKTAITEFQVALTLGPTFPDDVYNNMGNTYRSMGCGREAELAYRTALNLSPQHAHAWNNLGNAIRAQGKFDEAMQYYSASLTALPGFAPAHCNLAGLLRDQGKPQLAEVQYRAALHSDPNLAEAAAGLGTALRDMGRAEEAIGFYIKAVRLQPSGADHHANLANTYKDLNRIEDSILSYQAALELQPDMPDAFCNMVHSLCVICDWRNRKVNFIALLSIIDKQLDALLRLPSTHARLYNTLIGALTNSTPQLVDVNGGSRSEREGSVLSRGEESVDRSRRRNRVRHPSSPMSSRSTGSSPRNCDTSVNPPSAVNYPSSSRKATFSAAEHAVVAPVVATGLPSVQPFHALIYPMTPEKFRALSAAYASRAELLVQGVQRAQQMWLPPSRNGNRLKVGYVSSDYNNHPYSHLTQSVYGLHRGGNVECFCYALTPSDNSAWRHRIESEAENFRDISALNAQMSAQTIANDGIHVLVNCNGYTKGARTELFALRPAPVQVSFMGFPGTLGAHYIEYFITDVVTSPPRLSARMHSESLLYHPHTYFVNDHRQTSIEGPRNYPGGPLTRSRYGLPENCFLFIMHNQVYKIDPATFDVWARILKRVPGSKLWLLRFPPSAESRIRDEALLRGLSLDRLIFTDVAAKEEHVARCGLGDLFLDTPTCNAHTTGTDALWSGIPLITCPGSLFASRVAASLLTAAGFPELIAHDMKAYEELAVDLATNPTKLASIRTRLEQSRRTNPLFDTTRWVRNVELLYWQAWRRYEAGQQPANIFGKDVYETNRSVPENRRTEVQGLERGRVNRSSSSNVNGFPPSEAARLMVQNESNSLIAS